MNRALATAVFALPFGLAYGLYATGTLKRFDAAIDLAIARYRWNYSKPHSGAMRPLEQYAGWWQTGVTPNFGTAWVGRVIVRTEGKRAWLRMWHQCPPAYCEQGEFEASVYGYPPDDVYALQVVRSKGREILWTITLRPNGNDLKSLTISDERLGKGSYDNQSSFTALKRVK